MSSKIKFAITTIFCLLVVGGGYLSTRSLPVKQPEKFWSMPDFSLIDSDQSLFGSAQLKDQVWIANFIFTSCPMVCPKLTAKMSELNSQFNPSAPIQVISFTIDPETDTPQRLASYKKTYTQDARWHFLTGSKQQIDAVIEQGFKLNLAENGAHSQQFVLIDKQGQVRGFYDPFTAQELQKLTTDIRQLL